MGCSRRTATPCSRRGTSPGILRLGGTILGTVNRGNPFLKPIETTRRPEGLRRALHGDVPQAADRRHRRHRRRRHALHRARVQQEGHADHRRAQDDRQRHRRHDQLLRVRHGGRLRHRRHRPAAHDGAGPSAGDGRRGDGPLCRLDRALLGRGRRRRRDHGSRDSVRHRHRRQADQGARRVRREVQHRRRGRGRRAARAARCRW